MSEGDRFCVIGAGRIGLPISVRLSEVGCSVNILEVDEERVLEINSSRSPFFEEGMQESLSRGVGEGRIRATSDVSEISNCNVIISAIGTGIKEDGTPDIDSLEELVEMLAKFLSDGDLLILKTTLPIGTTERISKMLATRTGLKLDEELMMAFCPERIVEGKAMHELATLPKIVGGIGEKSADKAASIMGLFGGNVVRVADSRTAEMCKLLDNAYRITRFGFAADVAAVAQRTGIDAFEAIKASNNGYPRNNIPLPSVGVSGYCLTKDPYYLDSVVKDFWEERGFPSTWISARMAADMQTMESIIAIREEFDGSLENRVIVVAGITYKENVDDTRLSHGREIIQHLKPECEEIRIWDPMSAEDELFGIPVSRDASVLEGSDCLLITVPHTDFVSWADKPEESALMRTKLIFDGWGIFSGRNGDFGVRVIGTGIGTSYNR